MLQLIAALAVAGGAISEPEVGVDGIACESELFAPLDELQPLSPVMVVVELDGAALAGDDRRRLAVTADDSTLLGLLCLKASHLGFCTDADIASRRLGAYEEPEVA